MNKVGGRHPEVLWIAWTTTTGRMDDLARAAGGRVVAIRPRLLEGRVWTPIRYLFSLVWTFGVVVRYRPAVVVAMNPPVFCQAAAWLAVELLGTILILDSHPGAFGLQHDPIGRRTRPLHGLLMRRAFAVLVATEELARQVPRGTRALVVHEPPPSAIQAPAVPAREILVAGVFARDEPIDPILEAAQQVPGWQFAVTGDVQRASPALLARFPHNVAAVGFLPQEVFLGRMASAQAVTVVTDEPASVPRAGYEATYVETPLLISDTDSTRRYFPHAIHFDNTSEGYVEALRRLSRMTLVERQERVERARHHAISTWQAQLSELRETIRAAYGSGPSPG